jgi:phospholipid transport system substrate-binding protein
MPFSRHWLGISDGIYVARHPFQLTRKAMRQRPHVEMHMNFHKFVLFLCVFVIVGLLNVGPLKAGAPTEQIQGAVERVTTILKDPKLQTETKRKELRQAVYPKFDFTEMAKRSLGSHWQRRTPDEQQEFVKLFTDLIESAYLSSLDSYQGEKVIVGAEKRDQDYAEVDTKIITKKGEEFSVNYKLRQAGSDWKIYDVVIENISLVNNYRSQFNRVIAQSSFDDLCRKMKDRQFEAAGKKRT